MYSEDQLLPISALQHLLFCERQCALIHIEQVWAENRLTAEGCVLHERVHEAADEVRGDVRIARALRLRSQRLGLVGQADVVEFHRQEDGQWLPYPIEYKRGKPKINCCDEVQLCAQAMCLEEMLETSVPSGALFYGTTRRRQDVVFDAALRQLTTLTAERLHALIATGVTPPARYEKKCEQCSLMSQCMPKSMASGQSAVRYLERMVVDGRAQV